MVLGASDAALADVVYEIIKPEIDVRGEHITFLLKAVLPSLAHPLPPPHTHMALRPPPPHPHLPLPPPPPPPTHTHTHTHVS